MGLITIVDTEGREHLIHTSQIGPQRRRWISPAEREAMWAQVWGRVDAGDGQVFSSPALADEKP